MVAIISNKWWFGLKRAIKAEADKYSRELARDRNIVAGKLVRKLEDAISCGVGHDVMGVRMAIDQHFSTKHKVCAIRDRMRALRNKSIAVA